MATINDVEKLVSEYQAKYRNTNLPALDFLEPFDLNTDNPICPPKAAKKGVYVIFSNENIIYIGKSSAPKKAIWHRIVDHFFSSRKSNWSSTPTHFVAWVVPDESFFEASSLEEFLIYNLRNELPDNKVGK